MQKREDAKHLRLSGPARRFMPKPASKVKLAFWVGMVLVFVAITRFALRSRVHVPAVDAVTPSLSLYAGPMSTSRDVPLVPAKSNLRAILQGWVTTTSGRPISGAAICVWDVARCVADLHAVSNQAGYFELTLRDGGAAEIAAWAPGHLLAIQRLGRNGATSGSRRSAAIALESAMATITGEVLDATGGPLIGASVVARAAARGEPIGMAISDENGVFSLHVVEGETVLIAHLEGYASPLRQDSCHPL